MNRSDLQKYSLTKPQLKYSMAQILNVHMYNCTTVAQRSEA